MKIVSVCILWMSDFVGNVGIKMGGKCMGACERFLKSLRHVRSKGGNGKKDRYDHKTYDVRVTRGISIRSKEKYLRCNQCNIFLHESLHFEDNYAFGRGPKKCPCCRGALSNRHNKRY